VSDLTVEFASEVALALAELATHGSLVVLATHARHAIGEALFGSVADRVLRTTERPVLLVGPEAGVPDPRFSTMVLPDDAGVGAAQVRPHAERWCEHLDAVPWVVQVVPPDAGVAAAAFEASHVSRVAAEIGPAAEWEVLHGDDPAARIVSFAAGLPAGMIAMAVPARHRLGPDMAGGAALRVVRHAPCPVLAVGRADH
jgi:nucleotide-binding universal stress UspA family protein